MVKEFTVERSKWLRGEGASASRLYRAADGKMCCVGFLGLACGLTPQQMEGKGSPADLNRDSGAPSKPFPEWFYKDEDTSAEDAFTIFKLNDAQRDLHVDEYADELKVEFALADREANIVKQFAAHGIAVTFVD